MTETQLSLFLYRPRSIDQYSSWLQDFQDKLLDLVAFFFFCIQVSLGNLETKETLKKCNFVL